MNTTEEVVHNFEMCKLPALRAHHLVLAKYLTTFEEYDGFCLDTNHPLPKDEGWGRGRNPVMNITWLDAIKFNINHSRLTFQVLQLVQPTNGLP